MDDDLRTRFTNEMKAAMKAGDTPRTSTIRMILARLKETDIAARPSGVDKVPDEQIAAMLRGMVKSRRESADLYRQGNRPDLAAKEEAEIAVIEGFLPRQMDEAATAAAIDAAIAETSTGSLPASQRSTSKSWISVSRKIAQGIGPSGRGTAGSRVIERSRWMSPSVPSRARS